MLLKDRVALVTGASRGIGAATARALARHGAAVGVNFFNSEGPAKAVAAEIEATGGRAVLLRADVRDEAQVRAMASEAERRLGPIDTLVLNAAVSFPMVPFLDYSWEDFEAKLVGEMKAAFHCCKAFVPGMVARGKGSIVAVSSGLSRQPGFGFCAHSTAKSGLDAFAKSLALELGPSGIRVNVVAPGLTTTDATAGLPEDYRRTVAGMTPLRRVAAPDDVAGAIVFLASDEARFVTGSYVSTSGGMQML